MKEMNIRSKPLRFLMRVVYKGFFFCIKCIKNII